MINYSIDEKGVLSVYYDNCIIAEISECNNMSIKQLDKLVKEVYKESELFNILMNKKKEKFLNYCIMFSKELEDTNKYMEEDYLFSINSGTLADLGCNVSYELANIGFELGYANWQFFTKGDFEKVKEEFLKMIIENEKIVGAYTKEEIKDIETRIKNAIENSDN